MMPLKPNSIAGAAVLAILLLALAACANPWNTPPRDPVEAGLQKAVVSVVSTRYGNYCGYGRRYASFSVAPVDQLDAACRAHDLCYGAGRNRCDCDAKLATRARILAQDKLQSAKLRHKAAVIAQGASLDICKIYPNGFLPKFEKPM